MEKLLINRSDIVSGSISIVRTKQGEKIIIEGALKTHKYIEEILEIESSRYKVTGINIFQEGFGSDDFFILYKFNAEELIIKGGESIYTEEEITKKEKELLKEGE